MKPFKTRGIKALSILMLVACLGTSVFTTSCKKEQKGEIDKKAVAQIGFYETYQYKDIVQDISKLCEAAGDSTLLKNTINVYDEGPVVCNVEKSDTAAINAIIEKFGKDILPANLKLMWTEKSNVIEVPTNTDFTSRKKIDCFQLIALKTDESGKPAMTGESIVSAETTGEQYRGYTIAIAMDKEGGKMFSKVTADNIGRTLAIVYKDKVLSYPIVNCQIDGGRVEISGNFTEQDAKDFVNVLYGKK